MDLVKKSDEDSNRSAMLIRLPASQTDVRVQLVERNDDGHVSTIVVNPERTTRCDDPMDLVELARQIQTSEQFVRARAVGRLELIADQMRHLQRQARRILEEAHRDDILHHAACNFKKVPGNVYYLYEKPVGNRQRFFSMISPIEWGDNCTNRYIGAYRLEADQSWTEERRFDERRAEIDLMDDILYSQTNITTAALEANSNDGKSIVGRMVEGGDKIQPPIQVYN